MANYKPDPLLTGAHIANQRYQSHLGTPNEHDVDAELFKDIRSSLGEKPRGWRAIASGFTQGLERGSKLSSLEDRKKDLEKYNKVMNYFEEVNNNALERKEWEDRNEQARKEVMPQILSYVQNFSQYDPVTRQNVFNMALNAYNKSRGTEYKLDSIDGANPLKATISDGDETISFDILNAFQDNSVLQAEAAKQMPSYQLEMQRQRQQQDLENRLRQEQIDIQRYNAETGRMGALNRVQGPSKEEEKRMTAEEMEKNTYLRLYELLKEGDPTISAVPGANLSKKIASNIPVIGGLFQEGLNPQQEYKELVADLKGQKFKKYGYRNQAEFENINTLSPDLPRNEALKFVESKLNQMGINPNLNTINVKNPETGEIKPIEERYLKTAIDAGWIEENNAY